MPRQQRIYLFAILISMAVGAVFGLLPRNWIEQRLGLDPDGGSGLLESLLIFIPNTIAAGIAIDKQSLQSSCPGSHPSTSGCSTH